MEKSWSNPSPEKDKQNNASNNIDNNSTNNKKDNDNTTSNAILDDSFCPVVSGYGVTSSKDNVSRSDNAEEEDCWIDITSLIEDCASSLGYSDPILSTETFNLQDSMAAMELRDRKMDSCEIPRHFLTPPRQEDKKDRNKQEEDDTMVFPRPAPTKLNDDILPLPWKDLTMENAAYIVIEILVRLESMLSGASVVESIFTCLYAHSPILADMKLYLEEGGVEQNENCDNKNDNNQGTTAQHVVYSSSLALVELTEIIRSIILHADIYEEEDFCANAHNITFYSDKDNDTTMNALMYALHLVEEQIQQQEKEKNVKGYHELKAVSCVLGFQLDFLAVCSSVARVAGEKVREVMEQTKSVVKLAIEKLNDLCVNVLPHLLSLDSNNNIKNSTQKNDNMENQTKNNKYYNTKALLMQVFDPFINRPLLGNSPVRKVTFRNTGDSISTLMRYVSQIDWLLCDLLLKGSTLGRIRRILDHFSSSSTSFYNTTAASQQESLSQQPFSINILCRSLVVLNLYFDDKLLGQYSLIDLIKLEMEQISGCVLSQIVDCDNNNNQQQHSIAFLNRLAKPIYDTLKLRVLNRNRQRAYMEAVMLQDWSNLQQEAHIVDVHYRKEYDNSNVDAKDNSKNNSQPPPPPYFSHYVLSTLIELMDLHVSLGIEVGLFQEQEDLATVYWYRDFLLSTLLNNWTAMRRSKLQHQQQLQAAAATTNTESSIGGTSTSTNSTSKKNKKKQNRNNKDKNGQLQQQQQQQQSVTGQLQQQQLIKMTPEDLEYEIEFMILGMKRGLCRGLVRFISALKQADILQSKNDFKFTSLEKQFQKRFELFSNIQQPPPLSYDDYIQGSDFSLVSQHDLLLSTSECFKASKTLVDKILKEMKTVDTTSAKLSNSASSKNSRNSCEGYDISLEDSSFISLKQKDINQLNKVCFGNTIYIEKLKQVIKASSDSETKDQKPVQITFDFTSHVDFCTIKLV